MRRSQQRGKSRGPAAKDMQTHKVKTHRDNYPCDMRGPAANVSITPKDERHRRTSLSCAAELQGIASQRTEKAKMPAYFDDVGQGSGNMQAECVGGLTCRLS